MKPPDLVKGAKRRSEPLTGSGGNHKEHDHLGRAGRRGREAAQRTLPLPTAPGLASLP